MTAKLVELVADLKEQEALAAVEGALAAGTDPGQVLLQAREAMTIVGQRFSAGRYFIPDLVYAGEILKSIVHLIEPHLARTQGGRCAPQVVLGTVAGDIHDIGKNLVAFMFDVSGVGVIDLGVDVVPQKFVDAARQSGSKVVALSGFLTVAFGAMKDTVDAIRTAGLRDKVKIMIGGGQVDEQVCRFTGADAYGNDAMEAVNLAKTWLGE